MKAHCLLLVGGMTICCIKCGIMNMDVILLISSPLSHLSIQFCAFTDIYHVWVVQPSVFDKTT
jgi:hypothetical protein